MRDRENRTERNSKSCGWKEKEMDASQRSQKGHKPKVLFSFLQVPLDMWGTGGS